MPGPYLVNDVVITAIGDARLQVSRFPPLDSNPDEVIFEIASQTPDSLHTSIHAVNNFTLGVDVRNAAANNLVTIKIWASPTIAVDINASNEDSKKIFESPGYSTLRRLYEQRARV